LKDLKQSTRQRFVALEFDYPVPDLESEIVAQESNIDQQEAERLVRLAGKIRQIREQGLAEGAGTRLLIYAGQLIREGVTPAMACRTAIAQPLTDDPGLLETLEEIIGDIFV
jgi:nitric oxide reductase NorQ protein